MRPGGKARGGVSVWGSTPAAVCIYEKVALWAPERACRRPAAARRAQLLFAAMARAAASFSCVRTRSTMSPLLLSDSGSLKPSASKLSGSCATRSSNSSTTRRQSLRLLLHGRILRLAAGALAPSSPLPSVASDTVGPPLASDAAAFNLTLAHGANGDSALGSVGAIGDSALGSVGPGRMAAPRINCSTALANAALGSLASDAHPGEHAAGAEWKASRTLGVASAVSHASLAMMYLGAIGGAPAPLANAPANMASY
mmetsp:Transcript_54685/g.158840  ORF Transcript_54685/g.158840 Transcript_54685/m.158840 type:complete len:256 (-) Transcript_54685:68-835(-)